MRQSRGAGGGSATTWEMGAYALPKNVDPLGLYQFLLVVERGSELVRHANVWPRNAPADELTAAFHEACQAPHSATAPGIPEQVVTSSEAVLQALAGVAPGLVRGDTAVARRLSGSFARAVKLGPLYPADFMGAMAEQAAFTAAAVRYAETAPWRWLSDSDLLTISSPGRALELPVVAVLGAAGQVFGLGFYPSEAAYESTREVENDAMAHARMANAGVVSLWLLGPDELPSEARDTYRALCPEVGDLFPYVVQITRDGTSPVSATRSRELARSIHALAELFERYGPSVIHQPELRHRARLDDGAVLDVHLRLDPECDDEDPLDSLLDGLLEAFGDLPPLFDEPTLSTEAELPREFLVAAASTAEYVSHPERLAKLPTPTRAWLMRSTKAAARRAARTLRDQGTEFASAVPCPDDTFLVVGGSKDRIELDLGSVGPEGLGPLTSPDGYVLLLVIGGGVRRATDRIRTDQVVGMHWLKLVGPNVLRPSP